MITGRTYLMNLKNGWQLHLKIYSKEEVDKLKLLGGVSLDHDFNTIATLCHLDKKISCAELFLDRSEKMVWDLHKLGRNSSWKTKGFFKSNIGFTEAVLVTVKAILRDEKQYTQHRRSNGVTNERF